MQVYRAMTIEDYDQVIGLWQVTESMCIRSVDSRQSISRYLEQNAGLSFVAVHQERIVGAVLVGTDGRRGYLQHLAVAETCRGEGIGKKLVRLAIAALSKIGIDKTHLFVLNENKKAQAFYEDSGWFARDEVRMFSFNASDNSDV